MSTFALARALVAVALAGVAITIAWRGRGGDFIVIALVAVIASCSVMEGK